MRRTEEVDDLNRERLEAIRAALYRDAAALRAHRDVPIDLLQLLTNLGIGLTVAEGQRDHPGTLRRSSEGWEIVISRAREEAVRERLSSYERFTIAHEIGHYLIEARFAYRPRSQREYWRLEDLCQEFAGELLIPDEVIKDILQGPPWKAADYLRAIRQVAAKAQVNLEPAAWRVLQLRRPMLAASLDVDLDESRGRVGYVRWVVQQPQFVDCSRRSLVASDDPFAEPMRTARQDQAPMSFAMGGAADACIGRVGDSQLLLVAIPEHSSHASEQLEAEFAQ